MAKATFWYAVMALAVVGSTIAMPTDPEKTDANQSAVNKEVPKSEVQKPIQQQSSLNEFDMMGQILNEGLHDLKTVQKMSEHHRQAALPESMPFVEIFAPKFSASLRKKEVEDSGVFDTLDQDEVKVNPFNQLINMYTNEFKNMLVNFEKNMLAMDRNINKELTAGSEKEIVSGDLPIKKITSKTEIINGHIVQVNETTYSNGDENHKSFYHFKKIQVLPESPLQNTANEEVISITKNDEESKKLQTNEIKPNPPQVMETDNKETNNQEKPGVNNGPVSLDDHFQMAAASFLPYGQQAVESSNIESGVDFGRRAPKPPPTRPIKPMRPQRPRERPPPLPGRNNVDAEGHGVRPQFISLQSDTLVNELAAKRQKATGASFLLPAGVEFVDAQGKPQVNGAYYFNNNQYAQSSVPKAQAGKY